MHKTERVETIKLADQVIAGEANQKKLRQQIHELGKGASAYKNIEDREPDISTAPRSIKLGMRGIL